MSSSDKELEQQLMEAGNKLLNPPPSVDELLPLLDQVENCLSKVEQSPTASMKSALSPSQNALVADPLFRHSDIDVKVAVASCISEITRITAPDAPYDDDQMKDVFQLIVSSFENLADKSSRSYGKRTSILETVAKVRSCVVMLDLECDALIIEMFQHFLSAIRDCHPENVFSSMETIMTLVLEESEEISPELLSPLLASAKKGNEEVLPVARKLGEKVLESCAAKVKPYLQHAVTSLCISLDDYSDIVGSICQEMSGSVEQNDHAADENKADVEIVPEADSFKQADPINDKSPKSVVSNGAAQVGEDDSLADSCSLKKKDDGDRANQLTGGVETPSNAEPDKLDVEKAVIEESKPEQASKSRGRKVNSSTKLAEPSESFQIGAEEEAQKLLDAKPPSKDVPSSPRQEASTDEALSLDIKQEIDSSQPSSPKAQEGEIKNEADGSQPSSPKAQEGESMSVASPSGSGSLPEESLSKKAGRLKRKDSLIKDLEPSAEDVPRKASEGTSDSETKPNKRSARKGPARISNEEKAPAGISNEEKAPARISNEERAPMATDVSQKESGPTDESEEKPLKQPSKKADSSSNNGDGSSLNQPEDKKQRSRGKSTSEKKLSKSSTKDYDKEKVSSPKSAAKSTKDLHLLEETPKTDTKRKRASDSKKASGEKDYDSDLVGLRVKVWWPHDRAFYDGVIRNYDPVKKKHEVAYDDGEVEILNLKRQRWEFIEDDGTPDEEEEVDSRSLDVASERPPKKKAKTIPNRSSKLGKVDASPVRGGGGSSSKPKSAVTKSGQKSKEVGKTDSKSLDDPKAIKKVEDDSVGKTKDKSGIKSTGISSKTASKLKIDDVSTSKTGKFKEDGSKTPKSSKSKDETRKTGKSKQDTPKVTPSAKGKSPKTSGKSNVNGTGKLKSGASKGKETEETGENSTDSDEPQESMKGKSLSSTKRQGSEGKSGKKRRRA
ncbi:nucleic acid binding protein, putative [Ricinus communis]|uniref:Nucleic acid binding protein, putative n=1 Tax=Ricinus communis TaxID=3988 RepID=B9RNW7_RICCO|nr:nucleic acid binding protein, putative [Ricinus communis]